MGVGVRLGKIGGIFLNVETLYHFFFAFCFNFGIFCFKFCVLRPFKNLFLVIVKT